MLTVRTEQVFELAADELWSYLGDFGDMGKWSGRPKSDCVQSGTGVGSLRTLHLGNGRTIVDRLESETDTSYTYSIVEGDLPFETYRATMEVKPLGSTKSLFRWTGEFEPKGLSDEDCIAFTERMYAMGIGLMKQNIPTKTNR